MENHWRRPLVALELRLEVDGQLLEVEIPRRAPAASDLAIGTHVYADPHRTRVFLEMSEEEMRE